MGFRASLTACIFAIGRNLRIARRRPDLLVQSILVPVVVLTLASIIFGAGDDWPIAVIDESNTTESRELIETILETEGRSGPYFRIIVQDRAEAETLVRGGRLHLAVIIPADFPQVRSVEMMTYNINSDAMKNIRLRVAAMANLYENTLLGETLVGFEIETEREIDISRNAFMGGSAVFLALMLGAVLIAANLFAIEEEGRTRKEILLSPLGGAPVAWAAAIAALPLAICTAVPTVITALIFGLRVELWPLLQSTALLLPAMVALGGVGVFIAHLLRHHRAIQPVLIMLALASYFAAGGFISVSALPPAARAFSAVWPPSYVFEMGNPLLHGFSNDQSAGRLMLFLLIAMLGLCLAHIAGRRELGQKLAGGQ